MTLDGEAVKAILLSYGCEMGVGETPVWVQLLVAHMAEMTSELQDLRGQIAILECRVLPREEW